MLTPTDQLRNLIDQFSSGSITLDKFKDEIERLAEEGAFLMVCQRQGKCLNAFHALALTNTNGVNDDLLRKLASKNPALVTSRTGLGRTVIHALNTSYASKECSLEDFKHTVKVLSELGDDMCGITGGIGVGISSSPNSAKSNQIGVEENNMGAHWVSSTYEAFVVRKKRAEDELLIAIEGMYYYGKMLTHRGHAKGKIASDLAYELRQKANAYFSANNTNPDLNKFKQEFTELLHSKDKEMGEYRTNWNTIVVNILIACTGIGAVCLAANWLYTRATAGRGLAFFQSPKTMSETTIDRIDTALTKLG